MGEEGLRGPAEPSIPRKRGSHEWGGHGPGFSLSPVPRKGSCHRLPSGMEGVPESRGSEGPGGQAKPKSPPIKKKGWITVVGFRGREMRCHKSRGFRRWRAHGAGCPTDTKPSIRRRGIPAAADVPGVPGHDQQLLLEAEALPGAPSGGPGWGPEGACVQHAAGGVAAGSARRQQHERPNHGRGPGAPEAPALPREERPSRWVGGGASEHTGNGSRLAKALGQRELIGGQRPVGGERPRSSA